ncbi:MAG: energy transducer TonB [Vicinamibacteria bacterium]
MTTAWRLSAALLCILATADARSEDAGPTPTDCSWSSVWPEMKARFPRIPEGAKLTDAKRKKGSIDRPQSDVRRTISGAWTVELVVDEKGAVRDSKILRTPAIDPPWPEYEAAVLDSVRRWKYAPVRIDGKPWPHCMVVTVRDR